MDFSNLFAMEYNIKFDQNKLQQILKHFQSKLNNVDVSVKQLEERCRNIEQTTMLSEGRLQKFQTFTIENLRISLNQFTQMNVSLQNFFGQQWVKHNEDRQNMIISANPIRQFEARVEAYNKETRQILQEQLSQLRLSYASLKNQQGDELAQKVKLQQNNFILISKEIKRQVDEKFDDLKSQLLSRNQNRKVQIDETNPTTLPSGMLSMVSKKPSKFTRPNDHPQHKGKNSEQKRTSINNFISQNTDPERRKTQITETLKNLLKQENDWAESQKNMFKQNENGEFQDIKNDELLGTKRGARVYYRENTEQMQSINKEISMLRDSINKRDFEGVPPPLKISDTGKARKDSSQNILVGSPSQEVVDIAVNKLKQQLVDIFTSKLNKILSSIQSISLKTQMSEGNISFIMKEFKLHKDDFERLQNKSSDFSQEIQTMKQSLNEITEKHWARIIEQQRKLNQLQTISLNSRDFTSVSNQGEQPQIKKFKQIQNYKKSTQYEPSNMINSTSGNIRISTTPKNSFIGTSGRDENAVNSKISILFEKVSKLEQKMKGLNSCVSEKNLPKLDASIGNTVLSRNLHGNMVEQFRKEMHKANQELVKTCQRLQTVKKQLKELQASQSQMPKKLQKLESDMSHISQIQQDRLIQLIKQLINRVLTDPFNNHYTNALKKQIHLKFLQIKHEYSSIWKDIQNKVCDRAQVAELDKIKQFIETSMIEIRTLVNKKAQSQDVKKGIKYIEGKVKQLYSYVKDKEDEDKTQQNRKYYMGKKL